MDETALLKLPYILAAQSQKHVTHNEALRALDALVQLAVKDKDLAAPPGSPAEGARYIVAAGPTGAWAGHAADIAAFQDGAWAFHDPREGWLAWVEDEDALYVFNGSSWIPIPGGGGGGVNPASLVGVNATADATNRLAVSSPAALFTHEGAGHQLKINKAAAGNTASVLFQTGFSGRAEFGLTGDDDFHVKVSPNGSAWTEALVINRSSGALGGTGFLLGLRNSILGTVAQSSGVPTGAVIESGGNANGAYTRWADGTQICTHRISSNTTWTYPAAFAATPRVYTANEVDVLTTPRISGFHTVNPSNAVLSIGFLSAPSGGGACTANASSTPVNVLAIGRWF